MKQFFDFSDPFYAPVKTRIAIVAVCAIWGLIELSAGAVGWGGLFIGLAGYLAWRFSTTDYTQGPEE
ncbi:MAG: hypothetical protein AAGI10_02340 [Pseudomonadota bacterium]